MSTHISHVLRWITLFAALAVAAAIWTSQVTPGPPPAPLSIPVAVPKSGEPVPPIGEHGLIVEPGNVPKTLEAQANQIQDLVRRVQALEKALDQPKPTTTEQDAQ